MIYLLLYPLIGYMFFNFLWTIVEEENPVRLQEIIEESGTPNIRWKATFLSMIFWPLFFVGFIFQIFFAKKEEDKT